MIMLATVLMMIAVNLNHARGQAAVNNDSRIERSG